MLFGPQALVALKEFSESVGFKNILRVEKGSMNVLNFSFEFGCFHQEFFPIKEKQLLKAVATSIGVFATLTFRFVTEAGEYLDLHNETA